MGAHGSTSLLTDGVPNIDYVPMDLKGKGKEITDPFFFLSEETSDVNGEQYPASSRHLDWLIILIMSCLS